jgi:hypothetical protein
LASRKTKKTHIISRFEKQNKKANGLDLARRKEKQKKTA